MSCLFCSNITTNFKGAFLKKQQKRKNDRSKRERRRRKAFRQSASHHESLGLFFPVGLKICLRVKSMGGHSSKSGSFRTGIQPHELYTFVGYITEIFDDVVAKRISVSDGRALIQHYLHRLSRYTLDPTKPKKVPKIFDSDEPLVEIYEKYRDIDGISGWSIVIQLKPNEKTFKALHGLPHSTSVTSSNPIDNKIPAVPTGPRVSLRPPQVQGQQQPMQQGYPQVPPGQDYRGPQIYPQGPQGPQGSQNISGVYPQGPRGPQGIDPQGRAPQTYPQQRNNFNGTSNMPRNGPMAPSLIDEMSRFAGPIQGSLQGPLQGNNSGIDRGIGGQSDITEINLNGYG